MDFESEIDALVGTALFEMSQDHIKAKSSKNTLTDLAYRQFKKECPTLESQQAYIDSFVRRSIRHRVAKVSNQQKAREALRFWFEVIWPHLPTLRSQKMYVEFLDQKSTPMFKLGDIVHHKKFDYRGVIVQVDPLFKGEPEWYESVARSRPPKNRPWYHVLVDHSLHATYVAERHLEKDPSKTPIEHPLLEEFFDGFQNGRYTSSTPLSGPLPLK